MSQNALNLHREKGPNRSSRASEGISTLSQNVLRFGKRPKKKAPTISKLSPLELQKKISSVSQNVLGFANRPKSERSQFHICLF